MNKKICFFDKKECLKEKNLSVYIASESGMKLQDCCIDCLDKIQKASETSAKEDDSDIVVEKENNITLPKCSLCKSTFNDICKNSKVGCPMCYLYFKNQLSFLLSNFQDSLKHNGKKPKNNSSSVLVSNIIIDLKNQLHAAKGKTKTQIKKLIKNLEKKST